MTERHDGEERKEIPQQQVVIIMGSSSDEQYGKQAVEELNRFEVNSVTRVGSAHKTPEEVLKIVREYDDPEVQTIFITIAGGQHALGPFVDFQGAESVIAVVPPSGEFTIIDTMGALRTPSGASLVVAKDAKTAARHAITIFAYSNPALREDYLKDLDRIRRKVNDADKRFEL